MSLIGDALGLGFTANYLSEIGNACNFIFPIAATLIGVAKAWEFVQGVTGADDPYDLTEQNIAASRAMREGHDSLEDLESERQFESVMDLKGYEYDDGEFEEDSFDIPLI